MQRQARQQAGRYDAIYISAGIFIRAAQRSVLLDSIGKRKRRDVEPRRSACKASQSLQRPAALIEQMVQRGSRKAKHQLLRDLLDSRQQPDRLVILQIFLHMPDFVKVLGCTLVLA